MTKQVDIVIVGAGFAGLACAKKAAELGLEVLVIDRKPHAGHSPHTTGIIVKEALETFPVPSNLLRKVEGIRLYSPALKHFDLASPGYYFMTTDTPGYLQYMAELAEKAGARIQFSCDFQTASITDKDVYLENLDIRCKYLIGADGARSKVAQTFGLSSNSSFLLGVEAEYRNVGKLDENRLHCFLDSELAKGYIGWVAPGVNVVQVGVACRPQYKPALKPFMDRISTIFDFSNAELVGHRGGLIPAGGKLKKLAWDRVLLLGDAAGVVSPLTAGGIYPALYTGHDLAEVIYRNLHQGGKAPAECLHTLYPDYVWKAVLRLMLDYAPPNAVLNHVVFHPMFRALAQTVFFHHKGLFSSAAWKDILFPKTVLGS